MPSIVVKLFAFDDLSKARNKTVLVGCLAEKEYFSILNESLDDCLRELAYCVSRRYVRFMHMRDVVVRQASLSDDECLKGMEKWQQMNTCCENGRIVSCRVEWD